MDTGKTHNWKVGDPCVAELNSVFREFEIANLITNANSTTALLIATEKINGEHITPRVTRTTDKLIPHHSIQPSAQPEKTMGYYVVQALTIVIPILALIGLVYVIFNPSALDDDK